MDATLRLRYQVSALSQVADDATAALHQAAAQIEQRRKEALPLVAVGIIAGLLLGSVLRE